MSETLVRIRPRAIRQPVGEMPNEGPLVDRFGRVHSDLRISVTDRCDLRCIYCMEEDTVQYVDRADLLSFTEIVRIARVARDLGVDAVRLTGGEPLQRARLVELVRALSELGFTDVSMTTNAMTLERHLPALVDAGLDRVNISCDSLRPDRFAQIRRRGDLATVLSAMDAAERAGLLPLKVNVVPIAGINDDEIVDFATFAHTTGRIVRFIEFMPLDAPGEWSVDQVVPVARVISTIDEVYPLEAIGADDPAPASRYRFIDGLGEIGVIGTVTQPFCGTCNRLRLTAEGFVRNCLFSDEERSLRTLIRSGADDEVIATVLREAVWDKRAGRGSDDLSLLRPVRSMSRIGG
jgi:GTP 3',8-cyclase